MQTLSDPYFNVPHFKTKAIPKLYAKESPYHVEYSGLEPLTSTLPVSRSSQMS